MAVCHVRPPLRSLPLYWILLGSTLLWALYPPPVLAQATDIFGQPGFAQDRTYFGQFPFEHIDTATGGLTLIFTDLALPGNAGRKLQFARSYSSKSGLWTFGLAGIVLRVSDLNWPNLLGDDPGPTLMTVDGGAQVAGTPLFGGSFVESRRIMMTDRFWRYDRQLRRLWMPDGSVSEYDPQGRLFRRTEHSCR